MPPTHQEPDGSFKHFEMKGGTFEGWCTRLNDLLCRLNRAETVFQHMDREDINGTALTPSILGDAGDIIECLLKEMELFRQKAFYTPTEFRSEV